MKYFARIVTLPNPIGNGNNIVTPNPIGNGNTLQNPIKRFLAKPPRAGWWTCAKERHVPTNVTAQKGNDRKECQNALFHQHGTANGDTTGAPGR